MWAADVDMTAYSVIALDLDGTLLDDEKHILPESLAALNEAMKAGIQVILVTGRHHTAVHPFYQAIEPGTPIICCNGAYLYDYHQQKVLAGDPLHKQQARKLLELAGQHYMHDLVIYTDRAIVYETLNMNINRTQIWVDRLPKHLQPTLEKTHSLAAAVEEADAVWKVIATHDDPVKLREFGSLLEQQINISCEWLSENTLEVAQFGISKGQRLEEWVNAQGIDMQQVIAFGDNYNDLSMLSRAGLSVAMANSDLAIQNSADLVTTTNQLPGIADVISRYALNK